MLERLLRLLTFAWLPIPALASLPGDSSVPECELRTRKGCSFQACLLPATPSYPRPTLLFSPAPGGAPASILRIHLHGWTQDGGLPRNPDIDFPWMDPASQPGLADLLAFSEYYDFASAACASEPEVVAIPLSRGHNDDHKVHLASEAQLRQCIGALAPSTLAKRVRLSAHSGGGSILARLARQSALENLAIERIKLLDAIYSEEDSGAFLNWLSSPHASGRMVEVHSVTPGTAGPARAMRMKVGPVTRDASGARLQRVPGAALKVAVDLSGTHDHYSIVPAKFANTPDQGRNILILGDSHSAGTFGQTLDRLFRETPDNQVRTDASCGSIIRWWYTGQATPCGFLEISESGSKTQSTRSNTPLMDHLLAEKKPELIIVELGANYMTGYSETTLKNDVRRLLENVQKSGAECIWVGPPHMRRFARELEHWVPLLKSLVENSCRWIDSREFTRYPDTGGDGIHYETPSLRPLAERWAREIHRIINENRPNP